jgi:hypothetical protein
MARSFEELTRRGAYHVREKPKRRRGWRLKAIERIDALFAMSARSAA